MAWTSVTGIDQRGRWRLRAQEDGTHEGHAAARVPRPGRTARHDLRPACPRASVRGNLRRTLENLKAMIEGEEMSSTAEAGSTRSGSSARRAETVRVAVTSGLARPSAAGQAGARAGVVLPAGAPPRPPGYTDQRDPPPGRDRDHRRARHAHLRRGARAHERARERVARRGPRRGRRRSRSCAATTAASSRPPSRRRRSARTPCYLNTAFAGPQLTEVVQREKPDAIVYDQEFTELLEDAGKRRKRFIGWVDDDSPPDPTLEELIEAGDTEAPVPPAEPGRVVILTSGTTGTPKGATRKQPGRPEPGDRAPVAHPAEGAASAR